MATQKQTDLRKLPKDKRPDPTTGQSAPERELAYDAFNEDEEDMIKLLDGKKSEGPRETRSVAYLAESVDDDDDRAKLRVRNAMRRLVQGGWVERVDRGKYRISEKGRKRMQRARA